MKKQTIIQWILATAIVILILALAISPFSMEDPVRQGNRFHGLFDSPISRAERDTLFGPVQIFKHPFTSGKGILVKQNKTQRIKKKQLRQL
ncbi:MAG: hypothetical protein E7038_08315 [Lentisphaerae bacterium]|nr:hypothetical protein [Lentisphaerota bacterium]